MLGARSRSGTLARECRTASCIVPMKQMQCVAYYLGQFHPTGENDRFWGEGFTEWHNVARARPLFPGHVQPMLPGKLGFYDLRCDDNLRGQMAYARQLGIDAFCHWHYWFAGRRLLHGPLDRMLELDPGFRFMLGWANESWTGVWHGETRRMLIEQAYDAQELEAHAELIARYIGTGSYLEIGGLFPFVIYKPNLIPHPVDYLGELREQVHRRCGASLYMVGNWSPGRSGEVRAPTSIGLDAVVVTPVAAYFRSFWAQNLYSGVWQLLRRAGVGPEIRRYRSAMSTLARAVENIDGTAHATVVTGWDNTPRSRRRGLVLTGYDAESFRQMVRDAIALEMRNDRPLLFVKSWNEWAEGNVIEPRFNEEWSAGEVFRQALREARGVRLELRDAAAAVVAR